MTCGLRDYGLEPLVWGGEAGCEHEWANERLEVPCGKGGNWQQAENGPGLVSGIPQTRFRGDTKAAEKVETRIIDRAFCLRCSAWRGSLGLEPRSELYVQHIVEIFREVRRVLRKDGVLWLNMGDGYAANRSYQVGSTKGGPKHSPAQGFDGSAMSIPIGLKPKDLLMMPAKVALALQADGWWLRSDIVWAKPNPMPESVTDRPTKAHEYVFLLTKSERYYYDAEAVKEPLQSNPESWGRHSKKDPGLQAVNPRPMFGPGRDGRDGTEWGDGCRRNLRSVWTIATEPFPDAHFATFPSKLVETCVKAGSKEGEMVLDPFCGSGTVPMVAQELGRVGIGVDLKSEYLAMAKKRTAQSVLL